MKAPQVKQGRCRECVRDITAEEIGCENGVKKIIDKLDKTLLQYENTHAYLAFKDFYNYRSSGTGITDFVSEFEYLYHKLRPII